MYLITWDYMGILPQELLRGVLPHSRTLQLRRPGGFKTSSFSPFRSRGKMSFSIPNPTIASRQMGVKDPFLATFPIRPFPPRENTYSRAYLSQETSAILSGTPCTEVQFVVLVNIDHVVKEF